jgi:hypothetical protein
MGRFQLRLLKPGTVQQRALRALGAAQKKKAQREAPGLDAEIPQCQKELCARPKIIWRVMRCR